MIIDRRCQAHKRHNIFDRWKSSPNVYPIEDGGVLSLCHLNNSRDGRSLVLAAWSRSEQAGLFGVNVTYFDILQ